LPKPPNSKLSFRTRPIQFHRYKTEYTSHSSFFKYPTPGDSGGWIQEPGTVEKNELVIPGIQMTGSEGHPFLSSKQKGRSDLGGDFFSQKSFTVSIPRRKLQYSFPREDYSSGYRVSGITYDGPICATDPRPGSTPDPPESLTSNDDLDELGATAISRTKPTNPVAGLTQALIEIRRDGLPHLASSQNWANRAQGARAAGSEYLNAQFGWRPLVNDVTSFTGGVIHADSVIKQYKQGIGRPTRKRYDFPTKSESTTTLISANRWPFGPSGYWYAGDSKGGQLWRTRDIVQNRWFVGCFTYYFPWQQAGALGDLAILAHELGLEPSPELLWNVAPWTWALDWFANTGDVISNWTAFHQDGLVMYYGYMMEHTIVTDTYSLVGYKNSFLGDIKPSDVVKVVETKTRRRANPYGFGANFEGLSDFQASILAALGISRGRR
jgi:hypothetical protein